MSNGSLTIGTGDERPVKKLKTTVKTYCRIRPRFEAWEDKVTLKYTRENVTNTARKQASRQDVQTTRFFTEVFGPTENNLNVFNSMVVPMLENVMNGYPSVLIAYGQTGSGKTYSMMGVGSDGQTGILQHSLQWLLGKSETNSIELTAVEVYGIHHTKLEFFDLLVQPDDWASKEPLRSLRQANNLTLTTPHECHDIVYKAHKASHFAPTARNPQSSRGHVAFVVRVKTKGRPSAFVVVDLAGSEGMDALESPELKKQVISYETRKMEAGAIKNGLGELRGMINELKRGKLQKNLGLGLRQLLMEHVTGNTILSFIFTLAPSNQHAIPTENTLRVADSAAQIKKQVTRIAKFGPSTKEIIEKLRQELEETNKNVNKYKKERSTAVLQKNQMESERNQLREHVSEMFRTRERVKQLETQKGVWEKRESELEENERESRRNIADLTAQIEVLSRKTGQAAGGISLAVADLRAQNDDLREKLHEANQKLLERGGEVKEHMANSESLQEKLNEMENRWNIELSTLRTENEQLRKRVQELEVEVKQKDVRINELLMNIVDSRSEEDDSLSSRTPMNSEDHFPTIPLSTCMALNTSIAEAMRSNEHQMKLFLETAWDKICRSDDYKTAVMELFEKIDTENDGVIDICEFTVAVSKYSRVRDQEAINDVFNKICSRMENRQKVMELADLENLIFVEGNKYLDQPLEVIFGKAVLSKINQPFINLEDDVIGDWLDFRSSNDYKWFGIDWATCWVEVDRQRSEIRVWKDNFKQELVQSIVLSPNKVRVCKGARDNPVSEREDGKQFHIIATGRIYKSVYQFRTYSNRTRDAWGWFIRDIIDDDVSSKGLATQIKLILGLHGNRESTRVLRFGSPNPLASEVLIKLKKIMEVDGGAVEKFGLDRELSDIKLLCRGKTLKPIETLKHGDVVYAQTSPRPPQSFNTPPTLLRRRTPDSPMLTESDFLAQMINEENQRRGSSIPLQSKSCSNLPRTSRVSLFNVRSWRSSAEPSTNRQRSCSGNSVPDSRLDVGHWV